MDFEFNGVKYKVKKDDNKIFSYDEVVEKFTDYFDGYDLILGDYAYGKLRLKGFCKKNNKRFNKINDEKLIDDYIKNKCAYGCKYFILEKI